MVILKNRLNRSALGSSAGKGLSDPTHKNILLQNRRPIMTYSSIFNYPGKKLGETPILSVKVN